MVCHPMPPIVLPPEVVSPKKKIKYCLGGGPCWQFFGGKFYKRSQGRQDAALKRLKDMKRQRKEIEYYVMKGTHQEIMTRVGPDW